MKGLEPMTNKQRQEGYRQRLHDQKGKRTTVVLCPEAVKALNHIQKTFDSRAQFDSQSQLSTKKQAIECALVWYAKKL